MSKEPQPTNPQILEYFRSLKKSAPAQPPPTDPVIAEFLRLRDQQKLPPEPKLDVKPQQEDAQINPPKDLSIDVPTPPSTEQPPSPESQEAHGTLSSLISQASQVLKDLTEE